MMKVLLPLSILTGVAVGQSVAPAYGQCGGQGWTGPTACEAGWTCTYSSQWYSQCLPGTTTITTSTTSSKTSTTTGASPTGTGFRWLGVSESVAEFGQGNYPGTWGVHFRFPELSTIDVG